MTRPALKTNARWARLLGLVLAWPLVDCSGAPNPIRTATPGGTPTPSAEAPSAKAPGPRRPAPDVRPAGFSQQRASVAVSREGATPKHSLARALGELQVADQARQISARSISHVGAEASQPLTLSSRVRMLKQSSERSPGIPLLFELPDAEQHLRTRLLHQGFEDRSPAAFLGFARALLPSLLLDPQPKVRLGVGAKWRTEVRFADAEGEIVSVREYELLEWHEPAEFGIEQRAPIALLACAWRDHSGTGPEQTTVGRLWHSAAWLYPVGRLDQKAGDGQISVETQLLIDNQEWPKLSQFMATK